MPATKPKLAEIKSGKPKITIKSLNTRKFTIVFKLPTNKYFIVLKLFLSSLISKIFEPVLP